MSDEKQKNVFKSKHAMVSYGVLGFGILGYLFDSLLFSILPLSWGRNIALVVLFMIMAGIIDFLYIVLKKLNFFGKERHHIVGMFLGLCGAFAFIFMDAFIPILKPLEDASVDFRFQVTSNAPASPTPEQVAAAGYEFSNPNPKAHPAINILGITQKTVNKYQGFPFSWHHYANLLRAVEGSKFNTIFFDIFFQDTMKNDYGLNQLAEELRKGKINNISPQMVASKSKRLSDAFKQTGKAVVDYGFETSSVSLEELRSDYWQKRIKILDKFALQNVVPSQADKDYQEWVDHPEPPIISIAKELKGIGYANIRKEQTGVNRFIPMVIRWKNPKTNEIKYYPSIDLIIVARYYGVDIQKDVQLKMGEYIKLLNIPKKELTYLKGMKDVTGDIMTRPNEERTITIPIDGEGLMPINFVGGIGSFNMQQFHTIAEGSHREFSDDPDKSGDAFKNQILLVAIYYATGVARDIHTSPFGDLAGIEHHANALNTILQQDFLTYAKLWVNYAIYIIIGLFIGFIVPRFTMSKAMIIVLLFSGAFFAGSIMTFQHLNYIHVFITPLLQLLLTMAAITGYKVLSEEENVKYIRSTFSKFVSKDVVNELLSDPDKLKLGGEKKELTIFFSDIRGFTTISESLSPEDLVKLLNDYLSVMTNLVIDYKGTIDKYMGDAIMAFWGAPIEEEDHAYYGCLTALRQLQELDLLQEKWKEWGWPIIDIGIGLNSGPAVAGNIGSSHRMEYTVMGDTINLGSRLEGTNKMYGTRIIISAKTYELVGDRVIVRELDCIRVKGKTEPITIFELMGIKDEEDYITYDLTKQLAKK